ncbi:Putative integral membrane protein [Streptomyces venezuelae]|uniref:ArnT family glycosyltransferase n=1 Tax=Streptomyces gardneri TaxID=66892 RepID=UPI0006BD2F74|nr:glycosyltransferase family 39 protein [Streptomyces gardneri]ALO09785.1 Putative integral membrane protein [Streptomyces venezuelae]QPK46847.1 glycosyltransferase family 39 protein [Streptomyces gardneri]WRK38251.1 glycosyltransferase family 39 protein [Streptomyces venezuelae]CUM39780.1 putative integral membrane protein [Streptomyces venezuelae]
MTSTSPAASPGAARTAQAAHAAPSRGGLLARLRRGRPEDAPWVRPAFLGLLAVTTALYLWNLSASGYANSFYSAAVQAGGESWKAFFFGSLDAANAITVDKPPAALWPMALSVRLFGLGSWQILVPEVLMGVATVAVLYAAVRRRFGAGAGLIAGAVLALTPVAALMFRFNNPDALLALLMTVAVYCVLRALEQDKGAARWLVWAGVAFGFAFLAKTLQAFLILPPLALVYVVCAPGGFGKRLGRVALGGLAMVVSAGWWVALVELWPAASRPYVGGSQTNSFLELTFGYNGLGRINGNETGSVGGGRGGGQGGGWGETGIGRMFNDAVGGQISWLLPAALILLVAGLVVTWRAPRTDSARSAFLVWGGSLLITLAVFSFMAGIFHEYYTVALAPYVAALVGMGAAVLWEERTRWLASVALAVTVAATAVWGWTLLGRTPDWLPWLRWAVLVAGAVAALGLLFAGRIDRRLGLAVAGLGLAAGLAGPFAYTLETLGSGHQGSIVTAGPAGGAMGGRGGPGGPGGGRMFETGAMPQGGQGQMQPPGGQGGQGGQMMQPPGQGQGAGGQMPGGGQTPGGGQMPGGERGGMGGGGMGGLLNGANVGTEAKEALLKDADSYTWAAATVGAQNAASYQLATEKPVMAIGGFNGSDPSPTLAQFKQYVAEGKIHYFIGSGESSGEGGGEGGGGRMGGGGPGGGNSEISTWVSETFEKVTIGGATFYDLTT